MDILADNCHFNPDTPHIERSLAGSIADFAKEFWTTATSLEVMRQIALGATDKLSTAEGASETLGAVGVGITARVLGAAFVAAPSLAYVAGREAALTVIKGPGEAGYDVLRQVRAPIVAISNTYNSATLVARNDKTRPEELEDAKSSLRLAAGAATVLIASGVGAASGDLGPQALSLAADKASVAAQFIGRASFPDFGLQLQPVLGGMSRFGALAGSAQGDAQFLTIPASIVDANSTSIHSSDFKETGGASSLPGGEIGSNSQPEMFRSVLNPAVEETWSTYQGTFTELRDGTVISEFYEAQPLKVLTSKGPQEIHVLKIVKAPDGRMYAEGDGVRFSKAGSNVKLETPELIITDTPEAKITHYKHPCQAFGGEMTFTDERMDSEGLWLENKDGLRGPGTETRILLSAKRGSRGPSLNSAVPVALPAPDKH